MNPRAALLFLLAAAACGREAMPVPPAPSLKPECGEASYYHRSLAGNPTASGETYDPAAMTAAHNSLDFGAMVTVRRRYDEDGDGGETVMVRINDRGPFVKGRIIDLSPAAAKEIGIFGEDGVAEVCLFAAPRPSSLPRDHRHP
ncbi:septal ring lytic transglycosylase RlpA family protein [Hyphococcus sp.]|uniref:septal ring lytic transglycosylase RlpA family protein n=1 Tax=Hyphococcus sp. TaxID=2038636 RepID=UPI003D10016E